MLRKIAFAALTVMIITMTFSFVAWSEPNPKQTKSQGKSEKLSAQKTTDQIKPADNIVTNQQLIDAISRAIDAAAQKAKTTQNPSPPDNSTFWFSLFLVIFTGGLVAVGIAQWYIIFNTLKETQKVANAAIEGAIVAKTALQVAERAYLKIDKFEFVNFEVNKFPRVTYEIHNAGHTPAQIIESLTIIDIVDKSFPAVPIYDSEIGTIGPKHSFIQPDEKRGMIGTRKRVVTSEEIKSINDNTKLIFTWGKIIFCDIFDKLWIIGFGAILTDVLGTVLMDGYNYTKEYEQDDKQS